MAISAGLCDVFKLDVLNGRHRPEHTYRIALYGPGAQLDAKTRSYDPAGEAQGEGYIPGGQKLDGRTAQLKDGTACMDFDDAVWPDATIYAAGALVYNASLPDQPAVCVLDFGREVGSTNGMFRVIAPRVGPTTSLVRVE